MHEIWIEQCDAAEAIRLRYGVKAAFDYVVAEKLLNLPRLRVATPIRARAAPVCLAGEGDVYTPSRVHRRSERRLVPT